MILTLSRQIGALGEEIAARLAAAFDLRLIDREAVYHAAMAAGMPESLLRQLMYQGQRSLAGEILDSLGRGATPVSGLTLPSPNPLGGLIAPMLPPVTLSLEEGVQTLGLLIKDLVAQTASADHIGGHALVLGQEGQVWLRGYQGACHVQIVAPLDLRVARVAEQKKLSPSEARRLVRNSDRDRADLLMRHHGLNWQDPVLYHLVINTGQVPVDLAISLIANVGQALGSRS